MSEPFKCVHLFSGLGGGGLGYKRAGFEGVGAFDCDAEACEDYEQLVGERATCADLETMTPAEFRRACADRPDVAFTSAPCKGFSGCMPAARAATEKYQRMNALTLRGVWLLLEAWREPPPLIKFENVPKIMSRGREWLERIEAMLRGYGYAVARGTHDCGELGGLAQHRRRFLLVARHVKQVDAYLRVPVSKRVRGIGEVLGELPVPTPGSTEGGPMHALPRLSALNWIRLALIPAGGDWRDLPPSVTVKARAARQNGQWGVEDWREPAHAVLGSGSIRDPFTALADPRVVCKRREGGHGVKAWDEPSAPVISNATIDNFPAQVADPRVCSSQRGVMGVRGWAQPSHVVRGHMNPRIGTSAVADPRVPELDGEPLDLDSRKPMHLVIEAADGTWHRPITTLEFAALQGLPVVRTDGTWLVLAGTSHERWRERIGNAVPTPAAEAMARSDLATLQLARDGGWTLDNGAIWVRDAPAEFHA